MRKDHSMGMSALRCCDNGDIDEKHDCLNVRAKKPKCTVIGCGSQCATHLHHRKLGVTYYSVCNKHLKEIKAAYLKEDVLKNFTI